MDRNQFIGLILMLVLITVYFQFFAEPPVLTDEVDNTPAAQVEESNKGNNTTQNFNTLVPEVNSDSILDAVAILKFGSFAAASKGNDQLVTIENEDVIVKLSGKGGIVKSVELKNYQTYGGGPLILVDNQHNIDLYVDQSGKRINVSDLYFKPELKKFSDSTVLEFTLQDGRSSLSYVYTLPSSGFQLRQQVVSNGFEKLIDAKNLTLFWGAALPKLERELADTRQRTSVLYYLQSEESDNLNKTSTSHEEETLNEPVKWVSFNQKFFTSAIIANKSFSSAFVTQDVPLDTMVVKTVSASLELPYTDLAAGDLGFTYYFGPNEYHTLKEVTEGFSKNLELGWFFLPLINKYVIIPIFNFLEMFIPNYGIIIIVMVLIIRLILSPLTYSSHISMAKMRVLKPELDAIKERTGGDAQKAQTEQMDLYRKAGINPLSGCIPVVLQFPILVSLFYFIPNAIELRLVPFLWAEDMSSYDSILDLPFSIPFYGDHVSLFTLLMAGSTILYTVANSQMTTIQGPMKTLQYIMPVMLLFFFNSYPSGLSYYYFISNIVSFSQIALFRRFIDEGKILRLMEENKKKNANKTKSKFQQRLENAMKASQEAEKKNKKK
ncbi:MAG: YidC/Oxa1 family membrane protein insertase [Cyclobacteriaceae bacterium]|jgi:YidC/Oxa1 family membrane protein insertase